MQKAMATAAGLHVLRDEYARTFEPDRALAAESLTLERNCAISSTWLWRSPNAAGSSWPPIAFLCQKPTDEANRCELRH